MTHDTKTAIGYAKENRLNVIWLCARCHSAEHEKERTA